MGMQHFAGIASFGLSILLAFPLLVLVWKLGLLLRTDAFDPSLGNLLVGELLHAFQSAAEEGNDSLCVVNTKAL